MLPSLSNFDSIVEQEVGARFGSAMVTGVEMLSSLPMRILNPSFSAVNILLFATPLVAVSCVPADHAAGTEADEKQDTSLASATDCKPTRGAVGKRPTSYTPPANNVRYVAKMGGLDPGQCGDGESIPPFLTLREAIRCAPTGATIVVKAGEYEEGELNIAAEKRLTLQRNGTDVVTLLGSRDASSGWTKPGTYWQKSVSGDTAYKLPSRPWTSDPAETCANGSCWLFAVDPPEQVFVNGQALTQVRTKNGIGSIPSNKFFYEWGTNTYYLGINPTSPGTTIRISYHNYALMVDSAGSVVRGITFKQYGGIFPDNQAAVYGRGNNQSFEDNLFTQNNAAGLFVYGNGCVRTANVAVRNNDFTYNGQMGLHVWCTDNAQVLNNFMRYNRWYPEGWTLPAHGGMKADSALNLTVKNNDVFDNLGQGLWLDTFSNDAKIVGNRAIGNSGIGIFFEISQRAMIVNNRAALNQEAGIWIANSRDVRVYNNALTSNGNGEDPGPPSDDINDANIAVLSQYSRLSESAPHTRNVTIKNNVSSMQDGPQFNLHVYAHAIGYVQGVNATGDDPPDGNDLNDFNVRTDRNAFWRYAPQNQPFTADPLFHWAFRTDGHTNHKNFFSIDHVRMPHNDELDHERPGQELTRQLPLPAPDPFDRAGPVDPFLVPLSLDSKGGVLLNAGVDLDDDTAAEAGVVKACGKNVGPFTFQ